MFNKLLADMLDGQYPSRIMSDLESEFNNEFYKWLESKNIKLFEINKTNYGISYETTIFDRFIRILKDNLERFHKLNKSSNTIHTIKDIAEGYNESYHRFRGKTPNEMKHEDINENATKKQ